MKPKLSAYIFLGSASIVLLLGLATFIAMLRALTVNTTLAAIESAFGSFVLAIILFVAAKKLYDAGLKRMKTEA